MNCLNCAYSLGETPLRFCAQCGQDTRVRAPTLLEFAQQFGGSYISTEGALWRTLWLLFVRPGELTLAYWNGRRRHFVLPLRLYLTVSVLAVLALRFISASQLQAFDLHEAAQSMSPNSAITFQLGTSKIGVENGKFVCLNVPQWLCKRYQSRLDRDREALLAELRDSAQRAVSNIGVSMFVLLPVFALWLKLLYWRCARYYTEHLVFALHVHAFWFAMLLVAAVPWWPMLAVACAGLVVYPVLAAQRAYGGAWWLTVCKWFLILLVHTLLLVLAAMMLLMLALAT